MQGERLLFGTGVALLAMAVTGVTVTNAQIANPVPAKPWAYATWAAHRDAVLQDPSLLRYYTFEGVADGALAVPDVAAKGGGDLTYSVAEQKGAPDDTFQSSDGRWPEKRAVRLDRGYLGAVPFPVTNKAFTIEAWVQTHGLGVLRGDSVREGATLLSAGIGYWDGWRLTLHYPEGRLGFEIGQPQPSHAVFLAGGNMPDGAWHHVATTWDGKRMRIYLDGLLTGSTDYAGDYTPPAGDGQFRIGFAGSGWGSAVLDVDEVAVYSRAFTPAEVLRNACLGDAAPEPVTALVNRAEEAFAAKDPATGLAACQELLNRTDVSAAYAATALLRLGLAHMEQNRISEAVKEFTTVADTPGIAPSLASLATAQLVRAARDRAGLPRSVYDRVLSMTDTLSAADRTAVRRSLAMDCCQRQDVAGAREQYTKILEDGNLSPQDRLNTVLQMAHALVLCGDLAGARAQYAQVASSADAPTHFRSYAQLLVAGAAVRAKDYTAAKVEYAKLATLPDAPESHRWEAGECLKEVERLEADLPARDPAWSRVQLPARAAPGAELYVAPDGKTGNTGAKDQPLPSLDAARDAIRALKRAGGLPAGGVTVHVQPGEYRLTDSFKLTVEDSGTAASPIVYRAAQKDSVTVTGGVRITGFVPVTDPAVVARLPEEARGNVVQCDLKAQGVTEFGELRARGFGVPTAENRPPDALELFVDRQAMRLARWPNEGFVKTGKVLDSGLGSKPPKGATFECKEERAQRWAQARDPWVFGFFKFLWADGSLGIEALDVAKQQITLRQPYTYGDGVNANMPYCVFNLLEEIDQPGEWYLDRVSGILYLYPPSDPNQALVQVSMLPVPFVTTEDTSYVTLENFIFELGRIDGVAIKGGEQCLLAGCTLRQLGGDGVIVDGGARHGVLSCDIYNLARGGTRISGGDRQTLTPGGHVVENCHIYDFSRIDRTYTPAVLMNGVGNRIAHNKFHGSPCHAIRLEGNDHVTEFNDIYDVVKESDDQGALDMWFNPSYRGDVFRYNYWHDISGADIPCGRAGMRLDDAISGVFIYGNIFRRCSQANFGGLQIHGGKDNIVENNIFLDCNFGISFSLWGQKRWDEFIAGALKNPNVLVNDLYKSRYAALAALPGPQGVNLVWRNLACNTGT